MLDAAPEIVPHRALLLLRLDELLERTGNGADTALDAVGRELSEQIEQPVRVFDSFVRGPVGSINLFLDAGAVKLSVGKSIDSENVAVVLVEPSPERQQRGFVRKLARGLVAQAQPDGVGLVRADSRLHRERVFLQRCKGFVPTLATVNVSAIGEVDAVIELHAPPNLPRRRGDA